MSEKPPWHQRTGLIALFLIFLLPVGLVLLWIHPAYLRQNKMILTGLFAFLLLIGFTVQEERAPERQAEAGMVKVSEANRPDPAKLKTAAHLHAKEYVRRALKTPSSASFPWLDAETAAIGEDEFLVRSYFDAQNLFGAMVRGNYTARLRYLGGEMASIRNWELLTLTIDDKQVYP